MKTLKTITFLILALCFGSLDSMAQDRCYHFTLEANLGALGQFCSVCDKSVEVKFVDDTMEMNKTRRAIVSTFWVNFHRCPKSDDVYDLRAEVLDANHNKIAELPPYHINSDYVDAYAPYTHVISWNQPEIAYIYSTLNISPDDEIFSRGKFIRVSLKNPNAKFIKY